MLKLLHSYHTWHQPTLTQINISPCVATASVTQATVHAACAEALPRLELRLRIVWPLIERTARWLPCAHCGKTLPDATVELDGSQDRPVPAACTVTIAASSSPQMTSPAGTA